MNIWRIRLHLLNRKIFRKESIPYLLILIVSFLMLYPQFKSNAYIGGLDSYFHMNGFYEDAMQIKTGHFSYFLSMFGFNQSGRIVNALYGPLFNYIMGAILLLCHTWTNFSFVTSFLVLAIAGLGMYLLLLEMHVKLGYATVLSCMYLVNHQLLSWVGNQEFTGVSACILPFAFLVGIKIAKRHSLKIAPLVAIMTIALQIHILTSVISAMVLIMFFLYGFNRSNDMKRMFKKACLSVIITIILNANIFAGMFEVLKTNKYIPTYPQLQNLFQASGITVLTIGTGTLLLMFAMFFLVIILPHRHLNAVLMTVCLFFLILSSAYFPWNYFSRQLPQLRMFLQYPQRFMPAFWISLYLLAGIYLTEFSNLKHQVIYPYLSWALIIIVALLTFKPTYGYLQWLPKPFFGNGVVRYMNSVHYRQHNPNKIRYDLRSNNLTSAVYDVEKSTPDYMPTNRKIGVNNYGKLPFYWHFYHNIMTSKLNAARIPESHKFSIKWFGTKTKTVALPVVAYKHTKVIYNGKRIKPKINMIGAIKLRQHTGVNRLTMKYIPGLLFKISITLMIIGWIVVAGWYCFLIL